MKLFLFICVFAAFEISAQQTLREEHFNLEDAIAMDGYDPVSYFTSEKPVKGKKELTFKHSGVTYYFSSPASRDLFRNNPDKYEPQYGGWCAYAMGESGEKVEVDPETFRILDGKLYLFYNKFFTNTLNSWNRNEKKLKVQADQNWLRIYR